MSFENTFGTAISYEIEKGQRFKRNRDLNYLHQWIDYMHESPCMNSKTTLFRKCTQQDPKYYRFIYNDVWYNEVLSTINQVKDYLDKYGLLEYIPEQGIIYDSVGSVFCDVEAYLDSSTDFASFICRYCTLLNDPLGRARIYMSFYSYDDDDGDNVVYSDPEPIDTLITRTVSDMINDTRINDLDSSDFEYLIHLSARYVHDSEFHNLLDNGIYGVTFGNTPYIKEKIYFPKKSESMINFAYKGTILNPYGKTTPVIRSAENKRSEYVPF